MANDLKDKLATVQAAQAVEGPTQSTVLDLLTKDDRIKAQLARALPRALSADRFTRILLTEVRQNPRLLECTPQSFLACIMDMAQLGLEPGPLGHAYLVPFRNNERRTTECTLILGYKGLITLARRSDEITSLKARAVFANDRFRYSEGLTDVLEHEPADGDRGEIVKFYAVATFTNGGHAMRVMSKADVDKIRKRARAKDDGPWVTDYESMGCKTVIRQLANRGELPLTIEVADAVATDTARELGLERPELIEIPVPPPAAVPADEAAAGESLPPAQPDAPTAEPVAPSPGSAPPSWEVTGIRDRLMKAATRSHARVPAERHVPFLKERLGADGWRLLRHIFVNMEITGWDSLGPTEAAALVDWCTSPAFAGELALLRQEWR